MEARTEEVLSNKQAVPCTWLLPGGSGEESCVRWHSPNALLGPGFSGLLQLHRLD